MSRRARLSAVSAFFLLVAIGVVTRSNPRSFSATSYGAVPAAHGVLFDTLASLGIAVSRSFARPAALPPGATIWWIEPGRLAPVGDAADAAPREPSPRSRRRSPEEAAGFSDELSREGLARWIRAGGTAVVFLPRSEPEEPLRVAGVPTPARESLSTPGAEAGSGSAPTKVDAADDAAILQRPISVTVVGSLSRAPRRLALAEPIAFADEGKGWDVAARVDGEPFILERALGAGRLVVVADPSFLWNRWLPRADAAPLALDFVRAYGVPRIDERAHGLSPARSALRVLAGSWAAPFFAGLALFGGVFAWLGAALPRRLVGDAPPPAPTLETYVASLASYYGASREYPRIFERYRELSARRLRRALGLPPDAPLARVEERAARTRGADAEGLALLAGATAVSDARGLARAAARLDELVKGVAR